MPNKRKNLGNGKTHNKLNMNSNIYENTFGGEEDESKSQSEDQNKPEEGGKKKDKKLVFLSKTVLEKILSKTMTTGT